MASIACGTLRLPEAETCGRRCGVMILDTKRQRSFGCRLGAGRTKKMSLRLPSWDIPARCANVRMLSACLLLLARSLKFSACGLF